MPLLSRRADLGALQVGEAALVTSPTELFCEIGQSIKRQAPFEWTAVAAYTDGAHGYVPTRAAYAEGGYEVTHACFVAPESGEMIEKASLDLLGDFIHK